MNVVPFQRHFAERVCPLYSSVMERPVVIDLTDTASGTSVQTISTIFRDAAEVHSQCVAIQSDVAGSVTYRELAGKVHALVLKLRGLIHKGQLVPVLLSRSSHQVSVILALAELGAAYVPLDAASPDSRLERVINATRAKLIIANDQDIARLQNTGVVVESYFDPYACLQDTVSSRHLENQPLVLGVENAHPDDIAAVLFTSGSTGEPKGVKLSHRNLIEPARMLSRMERIDVNSRLFQFASCSFDVHLIDVFCALFNGARLCQVSNDHMLSNLAGWIAHMGASVIHLTPSVISLLDYEDVPCLQYMVTCGEPVSRAIIQAWSSKLVLINLYGPWVYFSTHVLIAC
jgi:non-ribosomal peptide synthetase component F